VPTGNDAGPVLAEIRITEEAGGITCGDRLESSLPTHPDGKVQAQLVQNPLHNESTRSETFAGRW
jgi:hypothetical protein